jgi:tetratricopeptide (TPR) repeat protein
VPATDAPTLSALQAMAGNAALAGGKADEALAWFDKALAPAPAAADVKTTPAAPTNEALGAVQIDRARALVALNRLPEASGALEEAHRLAPDDPEGWLLSATLLRRGKDLERAQRDIEMAASLAAHGNPLGAQIGLEAGVIAMLDGREEAARKSWASVLATAPGSPEAATAQGYLDQIGPAPVTTPAPPASPPETSR